MLYLEKTGDLPFVNGEGDHLPAPKGEWYTPEPIIELAYATSACSTVGGAAGASQPGLTHPGSPVDVGDAPPGHGQPRVAPVRVDHPHARLRSTASGTGPVAAHDHPSTVRRPGRSVVQPGGRQEYPGVGAVGADGHHRRAPTPVELAAQRQRERDAVSSRGP